jgi:hypothetical protein
LRGAALFAASLSKRLLGLLHESNTKVLTYLSGEIVINLIVSRDSGPFVQAWFLPPRMATSFAQELTSMCAEMEQQIASLHKAMGSSS